MIVDFEFWILECESATLRGVLDGAPAIQNLKSKIQKV
jgi:hypothetical protein